jgi:phosphoribosyl 1,2-cyclic phosphodiesterase
MSDNNFYMKVWGARGSIPTPGPNTLKYGGNTSCLEIRCGDELIIFDAGTGIRELGQLIIKEEPPVKATILFSHLHWDHIQGFPFFSPFYKEGNVFNLYAEKKTRGTIQELLSDQMKYPYFPVPITNMPARMTFTDIDSGAEVTAGDAKIIAYRANHPDGCLSYRVEFEGKSIVYATDTEHNGDVDRNLYNAAKGADVFIYDCNYTEDEYKVKKGWGHSTWVEAVKLAKEAGAKKLILWHHDPLHDDLFIENLEKKVQEQFPNSEAAHENLIIRL